MIETVPLPSRGRETGQSTLGCAVKRLKRHPFTDLRAGLITGVADDDPSGIATYSQAGAQFGLNMLWTMLLAYPLMAAVQSACAQIGRVTGRGLAANIRASFPPAVLYGVVTLLLMANILNIAADVAAMGETAELVIGVDHRILTIAFALLTLGLQIFIPYHRYVFYLKWLTLSLLAYAGVLLTVHVPWGEVVDRTFWPRVTPDAATAQMVVAVFGTTISPYLFFWQASEEVEDMEAKRACSLLASPPDAPRELRRIRWDTWSGMLYSNAAAYCVILATAMTLHEAGTTRIDTAAQAADALRPLAGDFAFLLFALGILGVGLIGVPVLAGSAAYAMADALGWRAGLERKPADAKGFYGVITVSVLLGLILQFTPIPPMRALFWSAVLNGLVAVPLLVIIMVLGARRSIMGVHVLSRPTLLLEWLAIAVMAVAGCGMFVPIRT